MGFPTCFVAGQVGFQKQWGPKMKMTRKNFLFASVWLAITLATVQAQMPATNAPTPKSREGLRNTVILIIRHAEKPETGMELTPAGVARANAYTNYFKSFTVDAKPLHLDHIFATADSKGSMRPRLTAEPLGRALGIILDVRYKDKQAAELAEEIQTKQHGKQILICWHHGQIPALITALGGDPAALLPGSKWPDDVFSWVVELRYDQDGKLIPGQTKCINENLMPGDDRKKPLVSG
jgi:broad specificity phosphatase PhoE